MNKFAKLKAVNKLLVKIADASITPYELAYDDKENRGPIDIFLPKQPISPYPNAPKNQMLYPRNHKIGRGMQYLTEAQLKGQQSPWKNKIDMSRDFRKYPVKYKYGIQKDVAHMPYDKSSIWERQYPTGTYTANSVQQDLRKRKALNNTIGIKRQYKSPTERAYIEQVSK